MLRPTEFGVGVVTGVVVGVALRFTPVGDAAIGSNTSSDPDSYTSLTFVFVLCRLAFGPDFPPPFSINRESGISDGISDGVSSISSLLCSPFLLLPSSPLRTASDRSSPRTLAPEHVCTICTAIVASGAAGGTLLRCESHRSRSGWLKQGATGRPEQEFCGEGSVMQHRQSF